MDENIATNIATKPAHVPPERVVDVDVYDVPGHDESPRAAWDQLRGGDTPGVVWTPRHGGHWVALRHKPMAEVYSDHLRFSSRINQVPKEIGEAFSLPPASLDPPELLPYRKLFNKILAPSLVQGYSEQIRLIADETIQTFQANGQCNFLEEFAYPFTLKSLFSLMGISLDDAMMLKETLNKYPSGSEESLIEIQRVYGDYVSRLYDERAGKDGDDMLSQAFNQTVDGQRVDKQQAIDLCSLTLIAGIHSVASMVSHIFGAMATNSGQREKLLAEPNLIPDAVNEYIRRYPLVTNTRIVIQDTTLDGAELKAGECIVMPTALSGTDDQVNECPMKVDFERRERVYLTFGGGAHRCPGSPLALLEIRVAVEEWLKRIPEFDLTPGTSVTYTFHSFTTMIKTLSLSWDVAENGFDK